ncbi:hypothetical protein HHI36_011754 [Cryptolaemus montrouzieri]|uniref:Uncharacterized protein n=1 Tax=Cryptolaemus montrouzieri TaxID=559131 RepID=A0ABD2ND02_9CUCU
MTVGEAKVSESSKANTEPEWSPIPKCKIIVFAMFTIRSFQKHHPANASEARDTTPARASEVGAETAIDESSANCTSSDSAIFRCILGFRSFTQRMNNSGPSTDP